MNRRDFLHRSGFAAIAVAGLPLALRANKKKQDNKSFYKSGSTGKAGETLYTIGIYHNAINSLSNASDYQKKIQLEVKYYEGTSRSVATKWDKRTYNIENSEKKNGNENIWEASAKFDKNETDALRVDREMARNLKFEMKPFSYVRIIDSKGETLVELFYESYDDYDDYDCFLTTACVNERNLPDNCYELETLRKLRDYHMLQNREGKHLVEEYKNIGPQLIRIINDCENRSDIYNYIYSHLIVPSLRLIEAGRNAEAVQYYREFVGGMKERYLSE